VRIFEIASAEEQIELWKLVSNSVWQSLEQQQREEQQRKAAAAEKKRVAPKGGKRVGSAPSMPNPIPMPTPSMPPTKQAHPNAKQTLPPAIKPVPSAGQPAASAQPNAFQQSAPGLSEPLKSAARKDKELANVQSKSDKRMDDWHSKNTF
jgi:hypothetical protein